MYNYQSIFFSKLGAKSYDKIESIRLLSRELVRLGHIKEESIGNLDFYIENAKAILPGPYLHAKRDRLSIISTNGFSFFFFKGNAIPLFIDKNKNDYLREYGANYIFSSAGSLSRNRRKKTFFPSKIRKKFWKKKRGLSKSAKERLLVNQIQKNSLIEIPDGEYSKYFNDGFNTRLPPGTATLFTIISDDEEKTLREKFYKNVPSYIENAMDNVGVLHFIQQYKKYMDSEYMPDPNKDTRNLLKKKGLIDLYKDIFARQKQGSTFIDEFHSKFPELSKGHETIRSELAEMDINPNVWRTDFCIGIEVGFAYNQLASLEKYVLEQERELPFDVGREKSFIDFVFGLPYNEQNIGVNKEILRLSEDLSFVTDILWKEYSKGEYFQEYFTCLKKIYQKEVSRILNYYNSKKPVHDSFLWRNGHIIDKDLDYLRLYSHNADDFIEYFKKRTSDEKKVILNDMMDCNIYNAQVIDWFNKNELELIRHIGLE